MRIQRIEKRRRGTSAVEFALVLPVFLSFLLGVLEFARMGMASQVLTNAAREGCRLAALPGKTATDAQNRVNSVLSASGFPNATISLTPADPSTATGGTAIKLTVSVPFSSLSWLGESTFMNVNVTASATFASERP